jgi:UDP-N-acetylmuramyl pentapeptide synthase
LLDYLNTKVTKDSIILVKGSRSTGMDYIADKLKL